MNNIFKGIAIFCFLLMLPLKSKAQINWNMPPNTHNERYIGDSFAAKRPALTFNGFSGEDASNGYSLQKILEIIYGGQSSLDATIVKKIFNDIIEYERNKVIVNPYKSDGTQDKDITNTNSRILEYKAFVALVSYILEQNGVDYQHNPPSGVDALPPSSQAIADFKSAILQALSYGETVYDGGTKLMDKSTTSLENYARAVDLYASLENAYKYYNNISTDNFDAPELLDEDQKINLFRRLEEGILSIYVPITADMVDLGFVSSGISEDEVEAGNRPLQCYASMAYAAMAMEDGKIKLNPYYDPQTDPPSDKYIDEYYNFNDMLHTAISRAGETANPNQRTNYWNYQTDNGKRFWAEGPYYLQYALSSVVSMWHAARINGLLTWLSYATDPFHDSWFTTPLSWLADLSTPKGATPPLDDGNKEGMYNADILSWSGVYGNTSVGQKFRWIAYQQNTSTNGVGLSPDLYLLELAIPHATDLQAPPSFMGNTSASQTGVNGEQEVVIRFNDNQSQTHYLLVNGESGDAITRGEGHEQPDQMQFIYYVDGTSYLIDPGYNKPTTDNSFWAWFTGNDWTRSTWNNYYDNNVFDFDNPDEEMANPPHPLPKRIASDEEKNIDSLYYKQDCQNIYEINAGLSSVDSTAYPVHYSRKVMLIADPNAPYIIDINSLIDPYDFPMTLRYYGNSYSFSTRMIDRTTGKETMPVWSHIAHDNSKNLYFYANAVEKNVGIAPATHKNSYRNSSLTYVNEYFNTPDSVQAAGISNPGLPYFNTVAFFRINGSQPYSIPHEDIPYNANGNTPTQVWYWQRNANTIDVIAKRSKINNTAYNQTFEFDIKDNNGNLLAHLVLPTGKDYGFARLINYNGLWKIDSNYQINLVQYGYYYTSNATIGTYTYHPNADLYLGNNVTLTISGSMTLQSGTTVHLGTGATIQTTGSGKILATGTTFKPLSGNNSDHWAHILLNGYGGDQFTQCTFNGADQAIYENTYNDSFNRCTFQYNGTGIYAVSGLNYVTGSTISDNTDYGIYLGGTSEIDTDAYQSGSTFTPTVISNNPVGVYLTDSSWGVLFYSRIDSDPYAIKSYNSSHVEAGHYDYPDAEEGWNRMSSSYNYYVYNSGVYTAYARDNYYGGYAPPSFDFYGSVDYGNPLTYDPTISGAQGGLLAARNANTKLNVLTSAQDSSSQTKGTSQPLTTSSQSDYKTQATERVKEIFTQLNTHPDASGNYRLLQEAYSLVHLYDPADSTSLWEKLDTYSNGFKVKMQLATSDISGGKLQATSPAKSIVVSEASKQMGTTATLLKMDRLLHIGKWDDVQTLAEQISPYLQGTTAKSALLADQAVAWQHQKQFAKALAAYQVIEALPPDSGLASHYEAPDYKIIEATLQDSMKAYSQKQESLASAELGGNSELMATDNKQLPTKFSLDNSYPNPFNPTTTIPFSLPQAAHVLIQIYNIMGQRVATLANRQYQAGRYQIQFDGKDFASGIYFIRARLGKKVFTQRMTLIK